MIYHQRHLRLRRHGVGAPWYMTRDHTQVLLHRHCVGNPNTTFCQWPPHSPWPQLAPSPPLEGRSVSLLLIQHSHAPWIAARRPCHTRPWRLLRGAFSFGTPMVTRSDHIFYTFPNTDRSGSHTLHTGTKPPVPASHGILHYHPALPLASSRTNCRSEPQLVQPLSDAPVSSWPSWTLLSCTHPYPGNCNHPAACHPPHDGGKSHCTQK